ALYRLSAEIKIATSAAKKPSFAYRAASHVALPTFSDWGVTPSILQIFNSHLGLVANVSRHRSSSRFPRSFTSFAFSAGGIAFNLCSNSRHVPTLQLISVSGVGDPRDAACAR